MGLVLVVRRGACVLGVCAATTVTTVAGCGQILGIRELEAGPCSDTRTDAANCGSCGYACDPGAVCCEGACSTSCSLYVSSVAPARGPLPGGGWVTIKGAGFAANAQVYFGKARAPALALDAATIRALVPPGVEQKVDVRVVQGPAQTTHGNAFEYAKYGYKGPWQKVTLSSPHDLFPGISVMVDGRVLVTGGQVNDAMKLKTAEIYDPSTGATTLSAARLFSERMGHAQVTLLSGKVLVLGDWYQGAVAFPAEIYDPATDSFSHPSSQPGPLYRPYAVLLADGRVLITSGKSSDVILYDPGPDTFTTVAGAPIGQNMQPARLLDGRVLIAGVSSQTSYVFDPDTGGFSPAGQGAGSQIGLFQQTAMTLPDGRVQLLTGVGTTNVPIFDPNLAASGFIDAPYKLKEAVFIPGFAMLGDGSVLVLAGATMMRPDSDCTMTTGWAWTRDVQRIDTVAGVAYFDALPDETAGLVSVTLADGTVVAAGGYACGGLPSRPYLYVLKGTP